MHMVQIKEYRTPDWTLIISVFNQLLNVTFNCYIHIPYARKIMQRNIITNSKIWSICYTIYCTDLYYKFSISFWMALISEMFPLYPFIHSLDDVLQCKRDEYLVNMTSIICYHRNKWLFSSSQNCKDMWNCIHPNWLEHIVIVYVKM